MKFTRLYTTAAKLVYNQIKWKTLDVKITGKNQEIVFEQKGVEVPAQWSQNATDIFAKMYLRKAGVPYHANLETVPESNVPNWLCRSYLPENGQRHNLIGETSAWQVFHRLAGAWTYWGWREGYFGDNENSAYIFYEEIYFMLANQMAAPNSPQWFNTGLHWAYGIEGDQNGNWAFDHAGNIFQTQNTYERPQVHACFIQSINDDLVNPGGIMDLWTREVRLFKGGSGTGSNFSTLRGKGERLSGGGKSSGLMSFLEIGDRAAGAIKSGGTTRRAAKMVCLDLDHPEIEDFIEWKSCEERKALAMYKGSDGEFGIEYEGEAIRTVSGQNSNNSVRVTDDFLERVDQDLPWTLKERTTGNPTKSLLAKVLWKKICVAAWTSADPGVQFHDTINLWHTCKIDGQINASNPCSEYMFLDDTACNLASLNLKAFLKDGTFDINSFIHATRIWTTILDISVSMASYPSREVAEGSYKYRTLGLGYANLGGLLATLNIRYDSDYGRALAAAITALMNGISYATSHKLATELGTFPRFGANKDSMREVIKKHIEALNHIPYLGFTGSIIAAAWSELNTTNDATFRNAQTTLIAPTGTIRLVMDCETSGMEPFFTQEEIKSIAGGGTMEFTNLQVPAEDCALPSVEGGPCLSPISHIKMMAAIQPFLSGAISKTVNLPNNATIEDVDQIYREAHRLGLKAVALYRDGCKLAQPLNVKRTEPEFTPKAKIKFELKESENVISGLARGEREPLPGRLESYRQKLILDGHSVYLHTGNYADGRLAEIFLEASRGDSALRAFVNAFAKSISIGLQYGVPLEEYVDSFIHTKFEPAGIVQGHDRIKLASSIIDAVVRDLGITYLDRSDLANVPSEEQTKRGYLNISLRLQEPSESSILTPSAEVSPHNQKGFREGSACWECGEFALVRTGSCVTCSNCGANSGCG